MSNFLWVMAGGSVGATLSGGTGGTVEAIDGISTYDSTVGIRFNTNGTIETGTSIDGAAITWSSAGSWILNGTPDNSYSVRFTSLVQDIGTGDWTVEAAADDTWVSLVDSSRTWTSNKTDAGQRQFTCSFEVRKTAGAPPTTGSSSYTFNIENTA